MHVDWSFDNISEFIFSIKIKIRMFVLVKYDRPSNFEPFFHSVDDDDDDACADGMSSILM